MALLHRLRRAVLKLVQGSGLRWLLEKGPVQILRRVAGSAKKDDAVTILFPLEQRTGTDTEPTSDLDRQRNLTSRIEL
jgi:hypothetical protein